MFRFLIENFREIIDLRFLSHLFVTPLLLHLLNLRFQLFLSLCNSLLIAWALVRFYDLRFNLSKVFIDKVLLLLNVIRGGVITLISIILQLD